MQKGARSSQKGTEKAQNYVPNRRIYKHQKGISRCESWSPRHQYFNFLLLIGKPRTPILLEYICLPALLDSFFFFFWYLVHKLCRSWTHGLIFHPVIDGGRSLGSYIGNYKMRSAYCVILQTIIVYQTVKPSVLEGLVIDTQFKNTIQLKWNLQILKPIPWLSFIWDGERQGDRPPKWLSRKISICFTSDSSGKCNIHNQLKMHQRTSAFIMRMYPKDWHTCKTQINISTWLVGVHIEAPIYTTSLAKFKLQLQEADVGRSPDNLQVCGRKWRVITTSISFGKMESNR